MDFPTEISSELLESLHSTRHVEGLTHRFYRYPAQMPPVLAGTLIKNFSQPGDLIMDPFMGGGTSIVEALAVGRQAIGIDINSLAVFVTKVKTTPLSTSDERSIWQWAQAINLSAEVVHDSVVQNEETYIRNLPVEAHRIFDMLLNEVNKLSSEQQRQFMRCCLLRLGQWAIDGKATFPNNEQLINKFFSFLEEMLQGARDFALKASSYGITSNHLEHQRTLLLRSAVDAQKDERLQCCLGKPKLVVTSPPYVNVHVLYHRWQVAGRRETAAPYWIIGADDGQGASYYTLGSRSKIGQKNYFRSITEVYNSIKHIIHPTALVAQLVSFSDVTSHLPLFLDAMNRAGYDEVFTDGTSRVDFWRTVPNRKWYNRIDAAREPAMELLLFHRLRTDEVCD